jgi:lysophospholipase L1-like esterase
MFPVPATHAQSGADFTRFVGVGDSLTAGFKDGSLFAGGQQTGFYNLLADSMGTTVVLPLIAEPGIPNKLVQLDCQVGAVAPAPGVSSGRIDPTAVATDVAVPGQSMGDALNLRWAIDPANPATVDTLEDLILGLPYAFLPPPANAPRTQIETAVGLQPTFLSIWLGNNDALAAVTSGDLDPQNGVPTSKKDFIRDADAVFGTLAATNAKAVVLNVPDVTVIPYLFTLDEVGAIAGVDAAQIRLLTGAPKDSFIALPGLVTLQLIAAGQLPIGSMPSDEILTKKEIKKIRKAIKNYNKKLEAVANANGWAYVDVNAILSEYDRSGVAIPGVGTITTSYLGGLFSLDGIHPSATGHALVAAAAVDAINAKYGTSLARPNVAAIAATDPQVCMASGAKGLTLENIVRNLPAALAAKATIERHRAAN